jgi:hypothetical protein
MIKNVHYGIIHYVIIETVQKLKRRIRIMAKPETLKRVLVEQNIDKNIVNKINNGYENMTDKSPKKKKTEYLFHAINEMEHLLDDDTRQRILQSCACAVSGSGFEKIINQFAKKSNGLSLKEKIKNLNEIKHMGNPVLRKDGTILVSLGSNNETAIYRCTCPQISGVEIAIPKSHTYCICCAGFIKFHYENALGKKIKVDIKSSPFESMEKKPCSFLLTIIE